MKQQGQRLKLPEDMRENLRIEGCGSSRRLAAEVTFRFCPVCGVAQYRSSVGEVADSKDTEVIAIIGNVFDCTVCSGFAHRHPEVYDFIVRILKAQSALAELETE